MKVYLKVSIKIKNILNRLCLHDGMYIYIVFFNLVDEITKMLAGELTDSEIDAAFTS